MKLTFRFSGITKMLGGLVAGSLAVVTLGQPALGNVIYDLAANPPAVTVMQGQNGTDTLTVTLSMQSNEGARVQIPTNTTIMWQYLSGDRMDAVTGADVTGGSCFVFNNAGAVIGSNTINPGGSCSIVEKFTKGDPRNPNRVLSGYRDRSNQGAGARDNGAVRLRASRDRDDWAQVEAREANRENP